MSTAATHHASTTEEREANPLSVVQEMMRACIQCGTCSASCPNASAMDLTPRHLWRLVQLGRMEKIFQSHTFTLCSACYYCSLRCPRGLTPSDAMAELKQIAARGHIRQYGDTIYFCRDFVDNVRRNGRLQEMTLMAAYFMHMRRPTLPLRFASLGWKLQSKAKVSLPTLRRGAPKLEALFRRVEEMEGDGT
jgi:heterodisulfide reductase subunit C